MYLKLDSHKINKVFSMQTLFLRVWNDLDTIQIYIKDTR